MNVIKIGEKIDDEQVSLITGGKTNLIAFLTIFGIEGPKLLRRSTISELMDYHIYSKKSVDEIKEALEDISLLKTSFLYFRAKGRTLSWKKLFASIM